MSKTLFRTAAAAVAVMSLLLPTGASAATSGDCRPETSVKAYTAGSGAETDRVWVDRQAPTRVVVCIAYRSQPVGGIAIVADVLGGATLPEVDVTNDPTRCAVVVHSMTDPADVAIAVDRVDLAASTVCVTVENSTLAVQFLPGSVEPSAPPVIEVWRDGGTDSGWVDIAACPVDFALAVLLDIQSSCMSTNERIFP